MWLKHDPSVPLHLQAIADVEKSKADMAASNARTIEMQVGTKRRRNTHSYRLFCSNLSVLHHGILDMFMLYQKQK